jgi:hypothetical protein
MNFLNKNKKGYKINFYSKSLNNNYTSAFKDKINRFAENNSSVIETAIKNNYLSFDKLDNLEKNISTFLEKNINNSKDHLSSNKNEKEKVTINSYYNISNLNNFNDKALFNSLENIENLDSQKKDQTNKNKNENFSKSDKKRKRFVSEEGFNNLEDININEKNIENSELKKTALKNTKHVFNLNLGKIIDGDRLKNENIINRKINNKNHRNSNSDTDLNYSVDSKKAQRLKDNKISAKKNINNKASDYIENLESNFKINKRKNRYGDDKEQINEKNETLFHAYNNRNCNKPKSKVFNNNSLTLRYLENSNTDNDKTASKDVKNKVKNYIPKDDKNNKIMKNQTSKEYYNKYEMDYNRNNISSGEQKVSNKTNNISNQFIKIEENPSIKKKEINNPINDNLNKKNSDVDYCNYGDDVKNTKKSLYDEFFKNIETDNVNIKKTNTNRTNNIHNNNNYSGFINPKNNNSVNMLITKDNKAGYNENFNDSSLIYIRNKAGNITYRETSDKFYSNIINKNSIYETYNSNIPPKNLNVNLDIIQNENPGNYTSCNENSDLNFYQNLRSKNKFYL